MTTVPASIRPIPQSKWPLYSLLLLFLAGSVLPVEVISGMNAYFLVLATIVWASKKQAFSKSLAVLISCFFGIIATGFVFGAENDLYPFLKDAWYFINPITLVAVGYCFGTQAPQLHEALRMLTIAGVILAMLHLSRFAINPDLLIMPATEIRAIAGNGNFVVGISCALLLATVGHWKKMLAISPSFGWVTLLICGASMALAYSRTLVLVAFVFYIALRGLLIGRRIVKLGAVGFTALALIGLVAVNLPKATEAEKKTFSGKLLRSAQELTVSDYRDEQSINDNFRGFETARAIKSYVDGGPIRWLGGRGFGHFVDLGVYLFLGEGPMRYIPVLHNGILYVLVKTGAIGLALYLISFGWLYKKGLNAATSNNINQQFAGRLVQGAVAVILATSWLISGPFNKSALMAVLLLLGFCLAIVEKNEISE